MYCMSGKDIIANVRRDAEVIGRLERVTSPLGSIPYIGTYIL